MFSYVEEAWTHYGKSVFAYVIGTVCYSPGKTAVQSTVRPTCGARRIVQGVQLVVSAEAIARAFQRLDMSA